jgi:hypothetical protein
MFMDWKNNVVRIARLPIVIFKFNSISIKIQLKFFIELENQLVNSYENTKYPGQLMQS